MRPRDVFIAPDGRLRSSWRFALFIPTFVGLVVAFSFPVLLLVDGKRLESDVELSALLFGLTTSLSAGLAAYLLLREVDRRSFRTLGLWFYPGWGREAVWGLVGGFGLVSVVVGLLWAAGQVHYRGLELEAATALRAAGWYFLMFLPPAAFEELVFRGYPFQRLLEGAGPFISVFLLSALFGFGHLGNPNHTPLSTANTVLVGILLALAYLKTRGLWLPLGLHLAWNFSMGFFYSLPVSGIVISNQLWETEITGREWLSGSHYGPEGSVVTTGVVLLATFWLARTRQIGVSPALAKELQ